ncbi:MAG: hypothetical protein ACTMIR_12570 [Cellulomonadaceae bacterium]
MSAQMSSPAQRTGTGFGRVLVLVYGIFALAASARAGVQLATRAHEAPLAYGLSAFAAVVYVVATVCLARGTARARRLAWAAVGVEMAGVLSIGALSFIRPELFPEPTVWSHLGQGYGYVPLVLPMIGLWWLRRTRPAAARPEAAPARTRSSTTQEGA